MPSRCPCCWSVSRAEDDGAEHARKQRRQKDRQLGHLNLLWRVIERRRFLVALGIFGMGTAPSHRRQGIATAVVDALLTAAAERGTQQAYLQVETANDGAIALYRRLGFERSHGYHYRSDGMDPEQGC